MVLDSSVTSQTTTAALGTLPLYQLPPPDDSAPNRVVMTATINTGAASPGSGPGAPEEEGGLRPACESAKASGRHFSNATEDPMVLDLSEVSQTTMAVPGTLPPYFSLPSEDLEPTRMAITATINTGAGAGSSCVYTTANGVHGGGSPPPVTMNLASSLMTLNSAAGATPTEVDLQTTIAASGTQMSLGLLEGHQKPARMVAAESLTKQELTRCWNAALDKIGATTQERAAFHWDSPANELARTVMTAADSTGAAAMGSCGGDTAQGTQRGDPQPPAITGLAISQATLIPTPGTTPAKRSRPDVRLLTIPRLPKPAKSVPPSGTGAHAGVKGEGVNVVGKSPRRQNRWRNLDKPGSAHARNVQHPAAAYCQPAAAAALPNTSPAATPRPAMAQVRRIVSDTPEVPSATEQECISALTRDDLSKLKQALQRAGQTERGGVMVPAHAKAITAPRICGIPPLLWAIQAGATACAHWMLTKGGADTSAASLTNAQVHEAMARIVDRHGAATSWHYPAVSGMLALQAAICLEDPALVRILLQQPDIHITQQDSHGDTAMHQAAAGLYTAGRCALQEAMSRKQADRAPQRQQPQHPEPWFGCRERNSLHQTDWPPNDDDERPPEISARASEELRQGDALTTLCCKLPDLAPAVQHEFWLDRCTSWATCTSPSTRTQGPRAGTDTRPSDEDIQAMATSALPLTRTLALCADLKSKPSIQERYRQQVKDMTAALEYQHLCCMLLMIYIRVDTMARWNSIADLWHSLDGRGETFVLRTADAYHPRDNIAWAQDGWWQPPYTIRMPQHTIQNGSTHPAVAALTLAKTPKKPQQRHSDLLILTPPPNSPYARDIVTDEFQARQLLLTRELLLTLARTTVDLRAVKKERLRQADRPALSPQRTVFLTCALFVDEQNRVFTWHPGASIAAAAIGNSAALDMPISLPGAVCAGGKHEQHLDLLCTLATSFANPNSTTVRHCLNRSTLQSMAMHSCVVESKNLSSVITLCVIPVLEEEAQELSRGAGRTHAWLSPSNLYRRIPCGRLLEPSMQQTPRELATAGRHPGDGVALRCCLLCDGTVNRAHSEPATYPERQAYPHDSARLHGTGV